MIYRTIDFASIEALTSSSVVRALFEVKYRLDVMPINRVGEMFMPEYCDSLACSCRLERPIPSRRNPT